jgi:hypothetical protein
VYAYPQVDSLIWTAANATPAVQRALAFDQESGTFAFEDAKRVARFLDLRSGATPAGVQALKGLTSRDAYHVYGVANDGSIVRVTPADGPGTPVWKFKPPVRATAVYPQPDGSIIVVGDRAKSYALWRLFPPDRAIADSGTLPHAAETVPIQVGDRLYLASDSGLIGASGRTLQRGKPIDFDHRVKALAPTPSGDRVFVVTDSSRSLYIVDRYRDEIVKEIELPGQPSALRMDPLGRYLLARPSSGDSAWVIAVSTDRLIGSVKTGWRADLPIVAPDGAIVLLNGRSVSLVNGETLARRSVVANGGDDYWYFFEWRGFRPRAAGIDEPVSFDGIGPIDSTPVVDSAWADSIFRLPPPPPPILPGDTTGTTRPPLPIPDSARATGFTVSFANLADPVRARAMAETIRVDGRVAHVVPTFITGSTSYRVVLGPYSSRAEAERAGQASGKQYWVYEGPP